MFDFIGFINFLASYFVFAVVDFIISANRRMKESVMHQWQTVQKALLDQIEDNLRLIDRAMAISLSLGADVDIGRMDIKKAELLSVQSILKQKYKKMTLDQMLQQMNLCIRRRNEIEVYILEVVNRNLNWHNSSNQCLSIIPRHLKGSELEAKVENKEEKDIGYETTTKAFGLTRRVV